MSGVLSAALVAVGASVSMFAPDRASTGDVMGFGETPRLTVRGDDRPLGAREDWSSVITVSPNGGESAWDVGPAQAPRPSWPTPAPTSISDDSPMPPRGSSAQSMADAIARPFTAYRVQRGDTLVGIAAQHGITFRSLWWANELTSKSLRVGQRLDIPAIDGLAVETESGDTVESVAAEYGVDAREIRQVNGLGSSGVVQPGDRLLLPGVNGGPIEVVDESWRWPVPGGHLSQAFQGDHYALDIADDAGTPVVAARPGTVLFAGWRNNCGGYQVWIQQEDGLATTYNHLSSVGVGGGQRVEAGQRIGRVGATGCVTGPHVHFEVWRGAIWSGGRRVDPGAFY